MENKEHRVNQNSEGAGNIQVVGDKVTAISIFGLPIQGLFKVLLMTFLILQGVALLWLLCGGLTADDITEQVLILGFCCPTLFGIPSLFGWFLGGQSKDKRLTQLSLVTGFSSLLPCIAPLMISLFLGIARMVVQFFRASP